MLHPLRQERILLAHDLSCDLEHRARPLLEAAGQPIRVLQAFGDESLVALLQRAGRHSRMIVLVDQHAGQGGRVELDLPASVRMRTHMHVGHHRLHDAAAEGEAGLRIERTQLREHVENILLLDPAEPRQSGDVAFGDEIEAREEGLHRRVEPITLRELQGQAFGERAGAHARGFAALHERQHDFHARRRDSEACGKLGKIERQISGVVDPIDDLAADQAIAGRIRGKAELREEMLME